MTVTAHYPISGATAREIATSIEAGIRDGALPPGRRLPSVRLLASELEVSPATAASALRELSLRGLVVSHERRGSVVSSRPPVALPRPMAPVPAGVRDLADGNPDPALLPDLTGALVALELSPRLYGKEPLLPELRAVILDELAELGIPAGNVCAVNGALDGVERVLASQLRPGDRVVVEDPGYTNTLDLLRALGLVPVPVQIDERGLLPGALARRLEDGATSVLVTPRGQNPTGAALDRARADGLRTVLSRWPRTLVVEDDHLGRVAGVDPHTVCGVTERWAFVRSVAKSLGPDLRIASLAGDDETVARVEGRLQLGPGWVSTILQRLVVQLAADTEVLALLDRASVVYRTRREALIGALSSLGIAASGPTGLNVWVPVPDEELAILSLLREGLAVTPGSVYRLESPPAIRITTAALPAEDAPAVAEAVQRAAASGRRTRTA